MLFVYADAKAKYVAYPFRHVPADLLKTRESLIRDLEKISLLVGPITISDEALEWGTEWYERFHKVESKQIDETLLGGYINRKQTLAHKIAMCLVASRGNALVIERQDLERAVLLLTELEGEMPKVYSRIGMSTEAVAGDQIVAFVKRAGDRVHFSVLYKYMHKSFPDPKEFNSIITGLVEAGMLKMIQDPTTQSVWFTAP